MGWLEGIARTAKFPGLGKLAQMAVKHDRWPAHEATNPRSVENQLRALDQKKRTGQMWLDHRPEVREILAELLNVSAEALDPGLSEPDGPADPRLPLHELRAAEPINLRRERPFPGIPDEVLEPKEWGLTWWFAQSGSGRTLAGRWLEARNKAVFIRRPRWADAMAELPADPNIDVYIELALPDESEEIRSAEGLEGRNICVAAPFLPVPLAEAKEVATQRLKWDERSEEADSEEPDPAEADADGPTELESAWTIFKAAPPADWMEALVRWVGDRMQPDGGFEVEGALAILRKPKLRRWLQTPGDYLGVCGVIEEIGTEDWGRIDTDRVVEAFLKGRVDRSDLSPRSVWKPKELWTLFQGVAEGAIVNSPRSDGFVREVDLVGWLPPDALPQGDEQAVLARLAEADNPTPEDLVYVHARLKPTARTAIRELVRLHLLEPVGEGVVEFRPGWVSMLAAEVAMRRLLEEPSRGLGTALIHPLRAGSMLDLLREGFEFDERPAGTHREEIDIIQLALDAFDPVVPTSVVLVEALFVAQGLALLDPRLEASGPELQRLWNAQMSVVVSRYTNAPPQPLVLASENAKRTLSAEWYLAALALSERLALSGVPAAHTALWPWGAEQLPHLADFVFCAIESALTHYMRRWSSGRGVTSGPTAPLPFALDGLRLLRRLYERFGAPISRNSSLVGMFRYIAGLHNGAPESLEERIATDAEMDLLVTLAADTGVTKAALLDGLWRVPLASQLFSFGRTGHDFGEDWQREIWTALPPELIKDSFRSWTTGRTDSMSWQHLGEEQWDAVLDAWAADGQRSRHGLEFITERAARRVLREQLASYNAGQDYGLLWERFPTTCTEAATHELLNPPDNPPYLTAAWTTPEAAVVAVVNAVQAQIAGVLATEGTRIYVLRWAHHQVAKRGSGWLAAWGLLTAVAHPPIAEPLTG